MTDTNLTGRRQLADRIAETVQNTPAVSHLEPTLRQALAYLAQQHRHHPDQQSAAPADNIHIQIPNQPGAPTRADVTLDITVTATRPALATATDLAQRMKHVLTENGLHPGQIQINILSINHQAPGPASPSAM